MNILMLTAVFVALVLMSYGIFRGLGNRLKLKKRMAEPEATPTIAVLRREEAANPWKRRILSWLSFSGKWGLKDQEELSKVRSLLIQGGFRRPNAPAVFYGFKVVVALILPMPFLLFSIMNERLTATNLLISFMVGGLGYFLPQFFLQQIVKRRQERIDRALPDVLDLFIICMEAGLALQATINRVADEIRSLCHDFYTELQIAAGEMRTGIPRDVALRNLGQRTGVQSVQSLVTLMIQSDKLGTSIAQALRVQADYSRVQRTLRAEEIAGKLPVKILIPMLFFIFPAMFVVIIGPGVITVAKNLLPILGAVK